MWPVEAAQSYMCGQPNLDGFQGANPPANYAPPQNNGIWTCNDQAECYPTCGFYGSLFDASTWSCAGPETNAMFNCTDISGTPVLGTAANNTAAQCTMVCQPGFAMAQNGSCIDVATDPENCGQIGYVCGFNYTGYYAAPTVCAAGQCLNVCPMGYTPNENLCLDYQNDTYNCGSFGNQCNVDAQQVCENGQCNVCQYGCYDTS